MVSPGSEVTSVIQDYSLLFYRGLAWEKANIQCAKILRDLGWEQIYPEVTLHKPV